MNSIILKNEKQIELMHQSGQLLARVFKMLDGYITAGISTMDINNKVEGFIVNDLKARPASKGQYDFPFVLNASINEEVCHGMPNEHVLLKNGDIVNIDITLEKNGYIADSSTTYLIGEVSPHAKKLVAVTYQAMCKAIQLVKPGVRLGDIGHAIQSHAQTHNYSVVQEYCGHGIGEQMHEAPQVLHFGRKNTGLILKEGMVFTIEPMINMGKRQCKVKKDGWTVITKDKKLSAQWEHTVAVTQDGYKVLTLRENEVI
ncbi:type I methionyl aminopeptidase [Marinicellulosiphila megalodicopiae]|uniref:type I methionyl aminopeptidase n=1 Tax=Marinicellulosiphila megalodicopiae TaxID=2724896 RepID=UPI003BAED21D